MKKSQIVYSDRRMIIYADGLITKGEDDMEMNEYSVKRSRVRKTCCLCDQPITIGEFHHASRYKSAHMDCVTPDAVKISPEIARKSFTCVLLRLLDEVEHLSECNLLLPSDKMRILESVSTMLKERESVPESGREERRRRKVEKGYSER